MKFLNTSSVKLMISALTNPRPIPFINKAIYQFCHQCLAQGPISTTCTVYEENDKWVLLSDLWPPPPPPCLPNRKGKYMRANWPPQLLWPPLLATARTQRRAPTILPLYWTPQEPQQTLPRSHLEQQQVEGVKALKRWGSYLSTEPKRLTLCRGPASL